ncbi:hypothetical protein BJ912DRAFT_102331 [Pholiota molesta]|nr:hypothetical protein BJ912DRAFT_102331 [Pholiota molesta]
MQQPTVLPLHPARTRASLYHLRVQRTPRVMQLLRRGDAWAVGEAQIMLDSGGVEIGRMRIQLRLVRNFRTRVHAFHRRPHALRPQGRPIPNLAHLVRSVVIHCSNTLHGAAAPPPTPPPEPPLPIPAFIPQRQTSTTPSIVTDHSDPRHTVPSACAKNAASM